MNSKLLMVATGIIFLAACNVPKENEMKWFDRAVSTSGHQLLYMAEKLTALFRKQEKGQALRHEKSPIRTNRTGLFKEQKEGQLSLRGPDRNRLPSLRKSFHRA